MRHVEILLSAERLRAAVHRQLRAGTHHYRDSRLVCCLYEAGASTACQLVWLYTAILARPWSSLACEPLVTL